MNYNWNWQVFWQTALDGRSIWLETLLWGLGTTLSTVAGAFVIALLLGSVVGVARSAPPAIGRVPGAIFVELFRNVPLLVQMFLWYFVFPELLPGEIGMWIKQSPYSQFHTAVVCLGLYHAARIAEIVRSGLASLSRGQAMAGQALGLTLPQTYRYVLLPMAYRIIIPALTSEFLSATKNTSVAIAIGLVELTGSARAMQENTFQIFEAFTAATLLYLAFNLVAVFAMRALEARAAVPGFMGHAGKAGSR